MVCRSGTALEAGIPSSAFAGLRDSFAFVCLPMNDEETCEAHVEVSAGILCSRWPVGGGVMLIRYGLTKVNRLMLNPSLRLRSGVAALTVYVIAVSVPPTVLMPIVASTPAHAQEEQDRNIWVFDPVYDFECSVVPRFTDKNLEAPCGYVPVALNGFQPGTYSVDCAWTDVVSGAGIVITERVTFDRLHDEGNPWARTCFFDNPPGDEVQVTVDGVADDIGVRNPKNLMPAGRQSVTVSLGPALTGWHENSDVSGQQLVQFRSQIEALREMTGGKLPSNLPRTYYSGDIPVCSLPCRIIEVKLDDPLPRDYELIVYMEPSQDGCLSLWHMSHYAEGIGRYYGRFAGQPFGDRLVTFDGMPEYSAILGVADNDCLVDQIRPTIVGNALAIDQNEEAQSSLHYLIIPDYDDVTVYVEIQSPRIYHFVVSDDVPINFRGDVVRSGRIGYGLSNRVRLDGQVPLPWVLPASAEATIAVGDQVAPGDKFEVAPVENWLMTDDLAELLSDQESERTSWYSHWIDITLRNFPAGDYWVECSEASIETGASFFTYGGVISHDGRITATYDRVCKSSGYLMDGDFQFQHVSVGSRAARVATEAERRSSGTPEGPDSESPGVEGERSPESGLDTGGEPGLPGRPRDLQLVLVGEASRDEFEFKIEWFAPVVGDGGAVRDYVVSVSTPSVPDLWPVSWIGLLLGPVEETFFVERTVMPYRGAHDQRYTVSVAARNANGVGPAATREIETPPRPWTCAVDPGQRKYELETTGGGWVLPWRVGGVTRIKALQDFTTFNGLRVSKGVRGGQVDGARNLSQSGCSWIAYGASVSDNAIVSGDGVVAGNARVEDDAEVGENAVVSGQAKLFDKAKVYGSARVTGKARIDDHARIYGEAKITGSAHVYDRAKIYDSAEVSGEGRVYHHAELFGNALVTGDADVHGDEDRPSDSARVHGDAVIRGDARIHGTAVVSGEVEFAGDIDIDEGEYDGDVEYLRLAASVVRAIYEDNLDLLSMCTTTRNWSEPERRRNAKSMVEREILGKPVPSINFDISEILRLDCLRWKATWELLGSVTPSGSEFALQYGLVLLRAANIPRTIKISKLMQTTLEYAGEAELINNIRGLLNVSKGLEEASGRVDAIQQEEDLLRELMIGSLNVIEAGRIRFIEVEGDTRIQGQLKNGRWRYF